VVGVAPDDSMRDLEPAGHTSLDPPRPSVARGGARFKLSRAAFVVSVAAHLTAGYALSRHVWSDARPPPVLHADFFFELPRPRPPEAAPAPEPEQPSPEIQEPLPVETPAPPAAEVVEPNLEVIEPPAQREAERTPPPPIPVPNATDLDEARQRAAQEIVTERAAESPYMTFSIDDVAPPRPEAEPEPKRSIFDGTGEPSGPKVGQVGQARTKFGHRLSELCNALTGGFSLMGFGSFCAPPSDGEPSGLFPEVRPAYLDMLPECVDTRDTAPALALESPFPTIKCRMVRQEEPAE
jgi:hypothetical protein